MHVEHKSVRALEEAAELGRASEAVVVGDVRSLASSETAAWWVGGPRAERVQPRDARDRWARAGSDLTHVVSRMVLSA